MARLTNAPDETPTAIFNPELEDFTFYFDKKPYVIHSYEITTLPAWLARKFATQMADIIYQRRGQKLNYEDDKKAILEEIYVNI